MKNANETNPETTMSKTGQYHIHCDACGKSTSKSMTWGEASKAAHTHKQHCAKTRPGRCRIVEVE